ncbi:uncharacterized protein LOC144095340 [Amblyomma americanum]
MLAARGPPTLKDAKVVFIPKSGKSLLSANLRLTSLTSCVGKLMEHVLQARLSQYLKNNNLVPSCMFGCLLGLPIQDFFLQAKHHTIDSPDGDTKTILGVDLTKAFDNVIHAAFLKGLRT